MELLHDEISSSLARVKTHVDQLQQRLEFIGTKRDKVEEEIENIVESIHDIIGEKKERLLERLNDLHKDERQKIMVEIRDKRRFVSETKEGLRDMSQLMQTCPEKASTLGRALKGKYEEQNTENDDPRLLDLNLNVNFSELLNVVGALPIGDVDAFFQSNGLSVLERTIFHESSSTSLTSVESPINFGDTQGFEQMKQNEISTQTKSDICSPKLTDITVVETNDVTAIVTTDRTNKKVKSFYEKDGEVFYSFHASSTGPRGITNTSNSRVAVTLPDAKAVKFFKILPYVQQMKKLKTTKRYRGIAGLGDDRLVVGTQGMTPCTVDIINFQGTVLNSFETDDAGANLFVSAYYLCANQDHIIVSDCERKCITVMSHTGAINFRYGVEEDYSLKHPLGVDVDSSGEIWAVDCDSQRVLKIDLTGKSIPTPIYDIHGPHGIAVGSDGKIYVAEWNGRVKIFDTDTTLGDFEVLVPEHFAIQY